MPITVEDSDPDVLLIKVENLDPQGEDINLQDDVRESNTDDYRAGALPLETPHRTSPPDHHLPGTSRHLATTEVSYGRTSFDSQTLPSLLWTNGGGGGCGDSSVPGPSSLSISYPAGPSLGRLIMGGRLGPAGAEMGPHRGFAGEGSGSFSASAGSREGSEMACRDVAQGASEDPQGQDWYKCGRKKVVRKKTFLCKFCGKGFSSPANLEPHLRTHTGERPFGCTVCGKHFSQYWNLKIHKNVHTGERPYACPLCGERYADPSNLKKHQKRHHPTSPTSSSTVKGFYNNPP
ncbi:hypothetical protein DPEC_G00185970 [Dallia pectoralis]|uniref:Uncharacterized protein n=1 Tax=Dallia pectoralis TaxID=75939 RepID=A0ACC2GC09_DALPE|nr:hypothetical protein DPEC_G00185970 [Dallia pectoralis]